MNVRIAWRVRERDLAIQKSYSASKYRREVERILKSEVCSKYTRTICVSKGG